jgi:hypothetical protein
MTILKFASVPSETWNAVVTSSPDGWPFALTNWRNVILSVEEWQLQDHSFAIAEDGQLRAVVPLQLDRRSRTLGMTGWGGCGPIVAAGIEEGARSATIAAVIVAVDRIAGETGARSLHFSIPPVTRSAIENAPDGNPLSFLGLRDMSGVAQVIGLSADEPALWRGLSETARQTVRKAEKAGVIVEQADWLAVVNDYYRIHAENYRRTGVEPHPKAYFSGIAREMARAGHSVLWVARTAGGEPIAFHNDMHFGAGAWYHTGCSAAAALDNGANYLLFWRAMLGAKAAGRRWYDCGEIFPQGGSTKQNGLTMFKTRFGGQPHRFLKAARDYAPAKQRRDKSYPIILLTRLVRRVRRSLQGA